jgi:hypothetical protein
MKSTLIIAIPEKRLGFGKSLNEEFQKSIQKAILRSTGYQISLNQTVKILPWVDQLDGTSRLWGGDQPIQVPASEVFVGQFDLWKSLKDRVKGSLVLGVFPFPNRLEATYEIDYAEEKEYCEIWDGE